MVFISLSKAENKIAQSIGNPILKIQLTQEVCGKDLVLGYQP